MIHFPCKDRYGWEDFLDMVRLLRSEEGCPWDKAQTHASIRRNFLEETYEALDAIDHDDPAAMCEELGDVLLQTAFHARIEEERGRFNMADVVNGVTAKLLYRHPHVFGNAAASTGEEALANWEARKRTEKGQNTVSDSVEAVPHTLPALWRAEKIQKKTARAGFDWDGVSGALSKLEEEVRELRQALENGRFLTDGQSGGGQPPDGQSPGGENRTLDAPHGVREELGDVLFITSKIAQMCGADPEDALHRACDKYQRRFRLVETAADRPLDQYTEAELVALWDAAKARLTAEEIPT